MILLMPKYNLSSSKSNFRPFLIGVLILGVLGLAVGATIVTRDSVREAPIEEIATERFTSPNIFVYAFWAGDKSEVKSFNLASGEDATLASLPLNVKHVKVLSPNKIVYINDTDNRDYGAQIVAKDIPNGDERIVVQANSDVRIDDYRVSPNGQYVATWEVSPPVDSEQLYGGTSRVYVTDINSGVKNQIYSEVANVPVHYPVAVTNDGRVFMDMFLPNDSAGWAYGMSVSDFSGANKQEISSMVNGSYGMQPALSPDGSMLVFTGYDGNKGSGSEIVRGMRRAIISSNSVDILDLNTLSRRKLSNLSSENYYSKASWDEVNGGVIIAQASSNSQDTGMYLYSLATNTAEKIDLDNLDSLSSSPKRPISALNSGIYLAGNVTTSETTLGNLGNQYEQVLDSMYIVNQDTNEVIALDIAQGFIQPISVKPDSYFGQSVIATFSEGDADKGGIKGKTEEQLQLQTFTIKPTLAPKREEQQSGGREQAPETGERCRDVAANACNELHGTDYPATDAVKAYGGNYEPNQAWGECIKFQWIAAKQAGCFDSPLYLYGVKGSSFNVKVGTPISNSNAPYSPNLGYIGVLSGDGGVTIDGTKYGSLEYDYTPAYKYSIPNTGVVINRSTMDAQLKDYAQKLGMNAREAYDFIKFLKAETSSGKFVLSHFSNEISKKILPLNINPEPDAYANIVFYVDDTGKKVDASYIEPVYEKISRNGFTAVEISYIVQR